ncbi:MAG: glycosyltransferase family 4 protein [Verrucomicrobia bacterium]|nr:glycosyltransferase family 4 protein [Verrucomicrobiota bacterium]
MKANSFREEFGILPSTFTFGVIGRWCSWKGQDHFMRIARKWMQLYPDSDVAFLLIGKAFNEDQGFESQLRNQAQEIHAQTGRENIRFIPFQSNLNTVLTELDCLVHASTRPEPFGRVVIEAMAAGVPVVGANGGAIPEIIDDGIDGLLAEAGSISAYLSAMKKIHDQPNLRSSLVVNATKKVQKKFSVDRVYHDFDQIISQSLKSTDV